MAGTADGGTSDRRSAAGTFSGVGSSGVKIDGGVAEALVPAGGAGGWGGTDEAKAALEAAAGGDGRRTATARVRESRASNSDRAVVDEPSGAVDDTVAVENGRRAGAEEEEEEEGAVETDGGRERR